MAALAAVWDLIARDGASPAFNKVAVSADRAAVAAGRADAGVSAFGKKAAAALGALVTIDIGAHMITEAAKFQRAMLLIQTQAGASATEVKTMSSAVLAMAGSVGTAPEKLATSLYHIESVGLRGAKALDVLKIAAEGAKVGNGDLEQTTNALTSAVASGIPGVQSMKQAMGALNAVVGAGDMKLSDLNEALSGGILTVVKGYGLSLRDVGAALATFGDNNIRGADAATMLRMAVQSMAVPAKAGKDELNRLGLTTKTLSVDMQKGGLNKAILDLKAHLDGAHVGAKQVGAVLTEVFGKRAGPGLAVLIGQVDRLEQKFQAVDEGSKGFGDAWAATQKTASFAFDKLKVKVETFGIVMGTKLLPAVTAAANWLGTNLPRAVAELSAVLGPVVRIVGTTLVGAWHALVTVLVPAAHALGSIIHTLAQNGVLSDAAIAVVALWAAFKGYMIAFTALRTVNLGLLALRANLMRAGESGKLGAAGLALFAVGVYAAGKAINSHVEKTNSFAKIADHFGTSVDSLSSAMINNVGSSKQLSDEWVKAQIHATGLDVKAARANISIDQLASAIEGGAGSTKDLIAQWKASGAPADNTIGALELLTIGYGHATGKLNTYLDATRSADTGTQDLNTAYNEQVPAAARADEANRKVSHSVAETGRKLEAAALSGKKLVDALNSIDGGAAATAEAVISFHQGLNGLKEASDKSSRAIFGNSNAALQNRAALVSLMTAARDHASALADQGKGAKTVAAALETDVAAFERTAIKAGYSKTEIRKLEAQMHLIPKSIETKILTKTQAAQLALQRLQDFLNSIVNRDWVAHVRATGDIQINGMGAHGVYGGHIATGGTVRGPGSGTSDSIPAWLSNGEEVINARQAGKHRSLLKAINAGVGGFANGGTAGKPDVYTVDGSTTEYGTRRGAMNAARREFKAELNLGVKINSKDLTNLNKIIHGTVDQAKAWFAKLSDHLKGLPGFAKYMVTTGSARGGNLKQQPLSAWLKDEDKKLNSAIGSANATAAKLKAVRDKMAQLRDGVKSAVTGFFDVTQAGANPVTGRISGAGMLAQQRQALLQIKKFNADLHRLESRHLNKAYLMELASQGPSVVPQLDALLAMSPRQFSAFNRNEALINRYGASAGRGVSSTVYGAQEKSLEKLEHTQRQAARDIIKEIRHELVPAVKKLEHQPINVYLDGKKIAEATRKSDKQTARR